LSRKAQNRILALFLAAPLLLPVQEAVRRKVAEPFPSLLMPAFSGVPADGETYSATKAFVEVADANGGRASVPGIELTGDAGVAPDLVLRTLAFHNLDGRGNAIWTGQRSSLRRNLVGQHVGRDREDARALIDVPEVQAWLRGRIADRFPGRRLTSATIVWRRRTIDRESRDLLSDAVIKTVRVFPR